MMYSYQYDDHKHLNFGGPNRKYLNVLQLLSLCRKFP
jgi:hypothetical protein